MGKMRSALLSLLAVTGGTGLAAAPAASDTLWQMRSATMRRPDLLKPGTVQLCIWRRSSDSRDAWKHSPVRLIGGAGLTRRVVAANSPELLSTA